MSHFCVAVHMPAGNKNFLADRAHYLEQVLQPWHEYESTGIPDQYVHHVDVTDSLLDSYLELKEAYIDPDYIGETRYLLPYQIEESKLLVRRLTGEEVEACKNQNYKLKNREVKISHPDMISENYYVLSVPERYKKTMCAKCHIFDFLNYAQSCYNVNSENIISSEYEIPDHEAYIYIENGTEIGPFHDESLKDIRAYLKAHIRVCEYTNPNAKWDWWSIGGRFHFLKKNGEKCTSCQIKDLQLYTPAEEKTADKIWDIVMLNQFNGTDEERQKFSIQHLWGTDKKYLESFPSKEAYIQDYAKFRCYAFVKDGIWNEPGRMGWWGISHATDENRLSYNAAWDKMIEESDPEDWLFCIDCHI